MTETDTRRPATRKRLLVGLGVGAIVVALVVAMLLVPRRARNIVTVDGKNRWQHASAPPRRQVVWQPAEQVSPIAIEQRGSESHIRPQLAENGTVLYFTVRTDGDHYDIYRSRLVDGGWTGAEPVEELNSPQDDVGPVIRADGKALYLYSDRDGGLGGMDLYVATRSANGWSSPKNLGPAINSPAHEYDPAVTPDGKRLFYASNRSSKLHQMMTEGSFSTLR